jgi:DNA-binding response OmpR family regulator
VRLLIVEDEIRLASALQRGLGAEGFTVDIAHTGPDGLHLAQETVYDAVILDIMLPELSGYRIIEQLRAAENWVPILMLTAKDGEYDEADALDLGADDYLTKPFSFVVLLARIRALLRRRPPRGAASLAVGDLQLNPDTREVRRGEREIELTNREFELLEFLMRNERLVISRERLLDEVWGYDPMAATNTIDVFISNLRRKLEAGGEPRLLHTKRGAGYVLKD